MQKYFQNASRFNGVYSRDNLPKIKDGAYGINLDEYSDIETHWISWYVLNNSVTNFDSFRAKHVTKEIKAFTRNKNIKTYFSNTSIRFDNVRIFLYWGY